MITRRVCSLAVLTLCGNALAGPLTPQAGPVASTMKTLEQVEPRIPIGLAATPGDADSLYRITQPGSYYLTGNVTGVAGKSGIEVAVSGVTIDLCGFQLDGSLSGANRSGITDSSLSFSNVTIRNGTIIGWQDAGITLTSAGVRIESVTASENGVGIELGDSSIVTHCVTRNNSGNGFSISMFSVVESCTASGNGASGIQANGSSTVRSCVTSNNSINGIYSANNGHIVDCTSNGNGFYGINASSSLIDRCHVSSNVRSGIAAGSLCTVTNNTCHSNGTGPSGGAGIWLASGTNRTIIRANNCSQNDWGILIDSPNNLVVGNSCTVNTTNFNIASGNRVGAIVNLPTSPAIFGESGGSTMDTNPINNFAF